MLLLCDITVLNWPSQAAVVGYAVVLELRWCSLHWHHI